jgi:hypothetical protein
MSNSSSRVRFEIFIAVLLVLGLYNIAQGDGLSSVVGQPHAREAPAQEPAAQQAPAQQMGVPSGAVMFFHLSTCPNGWTELSAARGRYIVARPAGGTLGATKGTALSNLENRTVGRHTHGVTDPGHAHGITDPKHSHTITDPKHSHAITDPGHHHRLDYTTDPLVYVDYGAELGDRNADPFARHDAAPVSAIGFTGISVNSGPTGITVNSHSTGISVNGRSTGISVNHEGSAGGTNAPYIQLLACQKD